MELHERISDFIAYKAENKKDFAELVGWSPQYLSKILSGKEIGLTPILAILKTFPELNARWLLLGEGVMLNERYILEVRQLVQENINRMLEFEKYIPVMTGEELKTFTKAVTGKKNVFFGTETIEEWKERLSERGEKNQKIIQDAMNKSKEICRTKKAKK